MQGTNIACLSTRGDPGKLPAFDAIWSSALVRARCRLQPRRAHKVVPQGRGTQVNLERRVSRHERRDPEPTKAGQPAR